MKIKKISAEVMTTGIKMCAVTIIEGARIEGSLIAEAILQGPPEAG